MKKMMRVVRALEAAGFEIYFADELERKGQYGIDIGDVLISVYRDGRSMKRRGLTPDCRLVEVIGPWETELVPEDQVLACVNKLMVEVETPVAGQAAAGY